MHPEEGKVDVGSSRQPDHFIAGSMLAIAAAVVVIATASFFSNAGNYTGFEVLVVGWAMVSAFASGAIAWRWTVGARSLGERRIYLTLCALGMTFVVNAAPYVLFWGFGFIFALVFGAVIFGWPAAIATGLWALLATRLRKSTVSEADSWHSQPRGVVFWSVVGALVLVAPLVGFVLLGMRFP